MRHFVLVSVLLSLSALVSSNEVKTQISKHVAIVSGCDSHLYIVIPTAYALLRKTTAGKYRVTFVTGSECKKTVENLGSDVVHHDSGLWLHPNYDTSISTAEYYENITVGSVIHPYRAMQSLAKEDKPDLIIAESFSVGASIVAETQNIPLLFHYTPGISHIVTWLGGSDISVGAFQHVDPKTTPMFIQRLVATVFFSVEILLSDYFCKPGAAVFEKIRREMGLNDSYDNYEHVISSFPSFSAVGEPISQMFDVPPNKFTLTGLLPSPPETMRVPDELKDFLEQSPKPVLYVSMGTYFVFSDQTFERVKNFLESQELFNVVWSHRKYSTTRHPIKDRTKMIILKKVPQKFVLKHEKVRAFLSHCGISSVIEGLSAGVAFLGAPQGRDQFYLSARVASAGLGLEIGRTPNEPSLREGIEKLHRNLNQYTKNVQNVYKQMSRESVQKLENLVDSLISKGGSSKFDPSESLIWSWNQALTHVLMVLIAALTILLYLIKLVMLLAVRLIDWLFFSEQELKKPKTN